MRGAHPFESHVERVIRVDVRTDGWSLAAERRAAGQRRGAAEKLSQHGAQLDLALAGEQRGFGLWNPTATSVGKIAREKISGDERACGWNQQPLLAYYRAFRKAGQGGKVEERCRGKVRLEVRKRG